MTAMNNFNEQTREYYQQAGDCARPRRHAAPGAIERKYPHIVELAVGKLGLDVELGRRIMHFHNSRHFKPRHGHILFEGRPNVLSLVFFGFGDGPGLHRTVWRNGLQSLTRDEALRIAANIAKLPVLVARGYLPPATDDGTAQSYKCL